ncbi:MAG TPA: AAA family ATPase [Anaeromyxobacteraceae bacterium]|nr:AAA family ATPase [Anaeromyxobacteraceae bacterium]
MQAGLRALADRVEQDSAFAEALLDEVARFVVGQHDMIERVLLGVLAGGHVLLEGVPGLAKTLTVRAIAGALDCTFQRIQFTPDLLPADLVGTQVWDPGSRAFSVKKGPVFANVVLADEVNRAPAKVQSALLEAMQERQVTLGDESFALPDPFVVLATQNPIEQEGTYPLPEAQVDRFMLKVLARYPSPADERALLDRSGGDEPPRPAVVAGAAELRAARALVRELWIDPRVKDYVFALVHATRDPRAHGVAEIAPWVEWGASPRATLHLATAARAHAFLRRRAYVMPDDVKAVAHDVLRHRVVLTYEAEAEEITPDAVIARVLERVPVP